MSETVQPSHEVVREQLLDDMAKVVLALEFAIQYQPDGHNAFLRILELVPEELRRSPGPAKSVDDLIAENKRVLRQAARDREAFDRTLREARQSLRRLRAIIDRRRRGR